MLSSERGRLPYALRSVLRLPLRGSAGPVSGVLAD